MGNIEKTVGIVKDFIDANPEATKEVSKSLVTITKSINVALLPLSGLVWGYERIATWLEPKLAERLQNVPEENIITPPAYIAGPIIEAMRFTGENDELREMYANVLASSMDKNTINQIHPRFVEVIKNLSQTEAQILDIVSKQTIEDDFFLLYILSEDHSKSLYYVMLNKSPIHEIIDTRDQKLLPQIDNLKCLSIFKSHETQLAYSRKKSNVNDIITNYPVLGQEIQKYFENDEEFSTLKEVLFKTSFGEDFIEHVVKPKK